MPTAQPASGKSLLSSKDHALILIDFQSHMAFATKSKGGADLVEQGPAASSVTVVGMVATSTPLPILRGCEAISPSS
jgi:hypothetical protein